MGNILKLTHPNRVEKMASLQRRIAEQLGVQTYQIGMIIRDNALEIVGLREFPSGKIVRAITMHEIGEILIQDGWRIDGIDAECN